MDCGKCGLWFDSPHLDGLFWDDDEIVCEECGTTNLIGVEEGDGDEDTDYAYVSHWTCKHDVSEDDPCAECDPEDT